MDNLSHWRKQKMYLKEKEYLFILENLEVALECITLYDKQVFRRHHLNTDLLGLFDENAQSPRMNPSRVKGKEVKISENKKNRKN